MLACHWCTGPRLMSCLGNVHEHVSVTAAASATAAQSGAKNGYVGTLSDVSKHRREDDHDNRRPHRKDRQVLRLPALEARERFVSSQQAYVEHRGPRQIDQENDVLTQGGHAVRAEAELGDARSDGR